MADVEQDVNAAVDTLFGESSPTAETVETSPEQSATADAQTPPSETQSQEGQTQPAAQQTQQSTFFAEVAGRKYPSKEDFIKSHETLLEKSRRQYEEAQQWKATHDKWSKWDKLMAENPDFYRQVQQAEQRFLAAKQAGATNAQARQVANQQPAALPPEVMKKLEFVEKLQQDYQERQQERANTTLQAELGSLKSTFKLDDPMMKRVTEVMLEVAQKTGLEVSAEWAYRDLRAREANAQALKSKVELQRVRGSDSNPSAPSAPAPKRKGNGQFMTKQEENAEAEAWANSFGVGEGE